MPKHRWFIEEDGHIAAHVALHEKELCINEKKIKIGGIAEVCVHPDFRGRGLVKLLLIEAHNWLKENNYSFSVLFANHPNVYSPSGYRVINNLIRFYDSKTKIWKVEFVPDAMVAVLGDNIWPDGIVDLNGIKF
jgi:predicted acetyltransferase